MICYLDSSALAKRYLLEPGSDEVLRVLTAADMVGTVTVSRVEVVAALARAVRTGAVTSQDAKVARGFFQMDWSDLVRVKVTEPIAERSCDLAWSYGLKGYDAVQLAAAASWQEDLDQPLTVATFDVQLWKASARVGLEPYPHDLPGLLAAWNETASPKGRREVPPS